ncbi:hypothetical protein ALO85_200177 [Pseudomonas syringae pv. aptata]|nr:hypothetical protein ALO85_200177 [Pseudomonas syringae pv. aptata]
MSRCGFSCTQVLEFHLQLLDPSAHDDNLLHRGRLLSCVLRRLLHLLDESLNSIDSVGECLLAGSEIIDGHGLQLASGIEPVIHAVDASGDCVNGFQVRSKLKAGLEVENLPLLVDQHADQHDQGQYLQDGSAGKRRAQWQLHGGPHSRCEARSQKA